MRILGIDTTTRFLCLGIYDNGKICEYKLEVGPRLSSLLLPTIKRILETLDWQINDIDYFACGIGPGSFTGVRIGMAAIKGLSFATHKPIIGISTLDILAKNVKTDSTVIPIIDARRNLIYSSIYKIKNGTLKRIAPYMLLDIDELLKKFKPHAIIFGDAVGLYKEKILRSIKTTTILDKDDWYLKGQHIIELALEKVKEKKFSNPFTLKPIYLYPKECQIKIV